MALSYVFIGFVMEVCVCVRICFLLGITHAAKISLLSLFGSRADKEKMGFKMRDSDLFSSKSNNIEAYMNLHFDFLSLNETYSTWYSLDCHHRTLTLKRKRELEEEIDAIFRPFEMEHQNHFNN